MERRRLKNECVVKATRFAFREGAPTLPTPLPTLPRKGGRERGANPIGSRTRAREEFVDPREGSLRERDVEAVEDVSAAGP